MQALLVVDVQNEFSPEGRRSIRNHAEALAHIRRHVQRARQEHRPDRVGPAPQQAA
jgi:nicotinamidase-related amidase